MRLRNIATNLPSARRHPAGFVGALVLVLSSPAALALDDRSELTSRLDRICKYLEADSANQRAAAERQLSEEIQSADAGELRAYLERRLPPASLRGLRRRFEELVGSRLIEVEAEILGFESARRLAQEQAEEDRQESTEDTRERLAGTRLARDLSYRAAHDGFLFLADLGIALAPPLWHRLAMGSSDSQGVHRFRQSLWRSLVAEARRVFPSAPVPGSISPFVERALIPLVQELKTRPSSAAGGPTEATSNEWEAFQERAAERAFQLFGTYAPADRREGRAILLELGSWGEARARRWTEEKGTLPKVVRRRFAEWNRLGVPIGFVERTGLDLTDYWTLPTRGRQELLYRLEWVGQESAVPVLIRLLSLEEDLSLKVETAAALARLNAPEGAIFLRQLGLREATELEGISRDVLLIEAIHRRDGGDHAGALTDLESLLRRFPTSFRVHYELALTALQMNRWELAIRHFRKSLELDPGNELAHYNLACAYALAGRVDDALAELRTAIDAGFRDADHTLADSDFESLRTHPEFNALIELMRSQ